MSSLSITRKWWILLIIILTLSGCSKEEVPVQTNPYEDTKEISISDGSTIISYVLKPHEKLIAKTSDSATIVCEDTQSITVKVVGGNDNIDYLNIYRALNTNNNYVMSKTSAGDYVRIMGDNTDKEYLSNLLSEIKETVAP